MDVWDPATERHFREETRPFRWVTLAFLVLLSAGGWCLAIWLFLALWRLA